MENDMRVRWAEIRNDDNDRGHLELYYILAEQISTEWTFYERSSWELRWYPIPSTKELVKRAIKEMDRQNEKEQQLRKLKKSAA